MFVNNLVSDSILVHVHDDTMVREHLFLVFLQQEVESFRKSSLTRWAEEIVFDAIGVRVAAPDDAERFEDVAIDVSPRLYWPGEFLDRRSGDVEDPGSVCLHPRVFENLRHLMPLQSVHSENTKKKPLQ